ncbi:MAG: 30S ribosomal protein S6 [Candidatus Izemoplasmatales bacterium]|uniref:Small ribosomal subunit protein bS6 n=1 Tax=Hujiaoplasma nucleasis TaxID=2725268 RepID=A0A7L6N466_9MOLU|nr:30S ribosomal protein S6 [Hujiaoplasma nucleasis]QLY40282.1 30S ribosomal protein S6 [Hujiaoplasma nucleasis]
MKRYEIMYIIRPNLEEEARKALITEVNNIFTKFDSQEPKVTEWGMRDLAYEINDFKKGYYVILDVQASSEAVNEVDRVIKIKEDVIRHIVIARDEM